MKKLLFSISFLFLILLGFLIWWTSSLYSNPSTSSLDREKNLSKNKITMLNKQPAIQMDKTASYDLDNKKTESIEETMDRLMRDVMVTGTILRSPGRESALFQIEGMPDREFFINTQLMDGFIITTITSKKVILTNQVGKETIILPVVKKNTLDEIDSSEIKNDDYNIQTENNEPMMLKYYNQEINPEDILSDSARPINNINQSEDDEATILKYYNQDINPEEYSMDPSRPVDNSNQIENDGSLILKYYNQEINPEQDPRLKRQNQDLQQPDR